MDINNTITQYNKIAKRQVKIQKTNSQTQEKQKKETGCKHKT
jgi:hypothetical protein